ncbi:hypothetical protein [Ottowia oryzae]
MNAALIASSGGHHGAALPAGRERQAGLLVRGCWRVASARDGAVP